MIMWLRVKLPLCACKKSFPVFSNIKKWRRLWTGIWIGCSLRLFEVVWGCWNCLRLLELLEIVWGCLRLFEMFEAWFKYWEMVWVGLNWFEMFEAWFAGWFNGIYWTDYLCPTFDQTSQTNSNNLKLIQTNSNNFKPTQTISNQLKPFQAHHATHPIFCRKRRSQHHLQSPTGL